MIWSGKNTSASLDLRVSVRENTDLNMKFPIRIQRAVTGVGQTEPTGWGSWSNTADPAVFETSAQLKILAGVGFLDVKLYGYLL